MLRNQSDGSHISWDDVTNIMAHLQREHGVKFEILMELRGGGRSPLALGGTLAAYCDGEPTKNTGVRMVGFYFPHGDYKTMPGAIFNALHRMDADLTQQMSNRKAK